MSLRLLFCAAAASLCVGGTAALADQATVERRIAVIEALDKVTARVTRISVPVGEAAAFRTLTIAVRACRTTPASQRPDNAAFLEIDDDPPEADPYRAFSGWMFSSAPSLSAMEHPVYDVWIRACADQDPLAVAEAGGDPAARQVGDAPFVPPLPPIRPNR